MRCKWEGGGQSRGREQGRVRCAHRRGRERPVRAAQEHKTKAASAVASTGSIKSFDSFTARDFQRSLPRCPAACRAGRAGGCRGCVRRRRPRLPPQPAAARWRRRYRGSLRSRAQLCLHILGSWAKVLLRQRSRPSAPGSACNQEHHGKLLGHLLVAPVDVSGLHSEFLSALTPIGESRVEHAPKLGSVMGFA